MASKCSGGRELTQLMADHVLGHIDRNVTAAVMDSDGVADKGREDRGGSRGTGGGGPQGRRRGCELQVRQHRDRRLNDNGKAEPAPRRALSAYAGGWECKPQF